MGGRGLQNESCSKHTMCEHTGRSISVVDRRTEYLGRFKTVKRYCSAGFVLKILTLK